MSGPELRHGSLRLRLDPVHGGAVAGLWLDRAEGALPLLRPMPEGATDAVLSGMFPMVPIANCLRDNRFSFDGRDHEIAPNMAGARLNFHGSGWRLPWEVVGEGPGTATLALEADDGTWCYRAEQHFALGDDGLEVRLSVVNRGPRRMPFGFGLHPWFPRHGTALVGFDASRLWRTDPEGTALDPEPVPADTALATPAPMPRAPVNQCHGGWPGRARVLWPDLGLGLTLATTGPWNHLMVHVPAHDLDTFCLEPQTNPPCGFDGLDPASGHPPVHILSPGASLTGCMTLQVSALATEPSAHEN